MSMEHRLCAQQYRIQEGEKKDRVVPVLEESIWVTNWLLCALQGGVSA